MAAEGEGGRNKQMSAVCLVTRLVFLLTHALHLLPDQKLTTPGAATSETTEPEPDP